MVRNGNARRQMKNLLSGNIIRNNLKLGVEFEMTLHLMLVRLRKQI